MPKLMFTREIMFVQVRGRGVIQWKWTGPRGHSREAEKSDKRWSSTQVVVFWHRPLCAELMLAAVCTCFPSGLTHGSGCNQVFFPRLSACVSLHNKRPIWLCRPSRQHFLSVPQASQQQAGILSPAGLEALSLVVSAGHNDAVSRKP